VVTELCAGTMTWGSFVKEEAEAHAQLDKLVELGVNFFDTAEIYPVAYNYGETTERWMGNWLEQRIAAGSLRREDVVIATKCNPAGIGSPEGTPHNFSLERLEASVSLSLSLSLSLRLSLRLRLRLSLSLTPSPNLKARASLARLKVESIDLYYLHFPTRMGFGNPNPNPNPNPHPFPSTRTLTLSPTRTLTLSPNADINEAPSAGRAGARPSATSYLARRATARRKTSIGRCSRSRTSSTSA